MAPENVRGEPVAAGSPIGIVGAGAVGQALGRLLSRHGEPVVALTSRDNGRAARAAAFIGPAVRVVSGADLPAVAGRILIAVSDDAIHTTATMLADAGMRSGVVLHTCGGRGVEALAPLRSGGVACGLLHPLQTIRSAAQGVESLQGISFGIAGDGPATAWADRIVALLGGRALRLHDASLGAYHAGAVMASNHVMAVIDAALVLFRQAGIPGDAALQAIGPLCRTSVTNALEMGPAAALTGPVARGDAGTVAAHLAALGDSPRDVLNLYRAAAGHLLTLAKQRGLSASELSKLESVLESGNGGTPHGSTESPNH